MMRLLYNSQELREEGKEIEILGVLVQNLEKLIGLIQEQQESFATDFDLNYLIRENASYSPRIEETTAFQMFRESAHNKSFEANRSDEEHENSIEHQTFSWG